MRILARHRSIRVPEFALVIAAAAAASAVLPGAAFAHGERAQEGNLRTRTASFYHVQFSDTNLVQGDRMSITGRFYLPRAWPQGVAEPEIAALTVASPGPVVLMKDRRIDGEFVPQTIKLELGRSYGFRIDLAARRPGRYHIHPIISVKYAGPLIGPGMYVNITEAPAGGYAANNVTLNNGKTANLETFNVGNSLAWHLMFLLAGAGFLVYWFNRPLVQRMATLTTGVDPGDMVTSRDLKVTGAFAGLAIGLVVASAVYAGQKWPDGVPLQVRKDIPAGIESGKLVTAKEDGPAHFTVADDTLAVKLKLRNTTRQTLTATEFVSGGFSFRTTPGGNGILKTATPITLAPGEAKNVQFSLVSKIWSEENLIPHTEVEVAFGGILVFKAPDGSEQLAEVAAPILSDAGRAAY